MCWAFWSALNTAFHPRTISTGLQSALAIAPQNLIYLLGSQGVCGIEKVEPMKTEQGACPVFHLFGMGGNSCVAKPNSVFVTTERDEHKRTNQEKVA